MWHLLVLEWHRLISNAFMNLFDTARLPVQENPVRLQRHIPFKANGGSFRSTASADGSPLGVLSLRIISASNLINMDTGILGDVSDPYVTARLASQNENARKRTHTIN